MIPYYTIPKLILNQLTLFHFNYFFFNNLNSMYEFNIIIFLKTKRLIFLNSYLNLRVNQFKTNFR